MLQRWRPVQLVLRPPVSVSRQEAITAALAAWAQWCEHHQGHTCELALSGHWLMASATEPGEAAQYWEHYLGIGSEALAHAWVRRSVVQPWALSCAAPRDLIDPLVATAREHRVTLRWVGPWWARDAQRWLAKDRALSTDQPAERTLHAREPGLTTYLSTARDEQGRATLKQVWTEADDEQVLPGERHADDIVMAMPKDALLADWPQPQPVSWRASWSPAWAEALDFVGPRIRTALWSWALLVGGMAACMAVSEQVQQTMANRGEVQAQLRRLERARHQQTIARAQPTMGRASDAVSSRTLDDDTARKAAGVAQLLAFPWAPVIERAEQAARQEQAVLMGFSLDTGSLGGVAQARPQVRLQAALQDDASALRWVAALGEGAQMLGRDALSTPFDTAQGHYALRGDAVWLAGAQP